MALVRQLSIRNFRGLKTLDWTPHEGVNALIGPGDSGKSTILDALDLVLGSRRNAPFSDADFFGLDSRQVITIQATIGALTGEFQNLERFGSFLRGWNAAAAAIEDEPDDQRLESVLTIQLKVGADLEPHWTLYSERAEAEGLERDLSFADRNLLAPTRLGVYAAQHLAWGQRSVLNRLAEDRPAVALALSDAARTARSGFGKSAEPHLAEQLKTVRGTARDLGVTGGFEASALLDVHEVAFGSGAISLHDADGVPLRSLGTGSSRLLVAGLQVRAAAAASVALIDELEFGLEPHRIVRLLHALGSKTDGQRRQIFLTTHSPTVIRELESKQLSLLRNEAGLAKIIGLGDVRQGVLRGCSEAFLAPRVIVCEGPTEIGLLRGLDLYFVGLGKPSLAELGVALADGVGANRIERARCFGGLGYHTALLHDADRPLSVADAADLAKVAISVQQWQTGMATEDQLFTSLPLAQLPRLMFVARRLFSDDSIEAHIREACRGAFTPADCMASPADAMRAPLGIAAKAGSWFKRIEPGEAIGRYIVGPNIGGTAAGLVDPLRNLWAWAGAPAQFDISAAA